MVDVETKPNINDLQQITKVPIYNVMIHEPVELLPHIKTEDPIEIWSDFNFGSEITVNGVKGEVKIFSNQTESFAGNDNQIGDNKSSGPHIRGSKSKSDKTSPRKDGDRDSQRKTRKKFAAKPYECDECQKKFADQTSIYRHKRIHAGERRYECETCHKKFTRKHHMLQHTRVHTMEKPFCCDKCQQKFSQIAHLYEHKKIHSHQKSHKCDECQRLFLRKSDLTKHALTHNGKAYTCTECPKQFRRKYELTNHLRKHISKQEFKCSNCSRIFYKKSNLTNHLRIHHP